MEKTSTKRTIAAFILVSSIFVIIFLGPFEHTSPMDDIRPSNIAEARTDTSSSDQVMALSKERKPAKTVKKSSLPTSVYKAGGVTIKGEEFKLEIADTDALRTLGLSNRESIATNDGLLFVFNDVGYYPFWMKDMNFSIDIIWLDSNMNITHIEKSLSPKTYPESYQSKELSKYVLEVAAGTSERLGVEIGDTLDLRF